MNDEPKDLEVLVDVEDFMVAKGYRIERRPKHNTHTKFTKPGCPPQIVRNHRGTVHAKEFERLKATIAQQEATET